MCICMYMHSQQEMSRILKFGPRIKKTDSRTEKCNFLSYVSNLRPIANCICIGLYRILFRNVYI